jgi:glyoxylate utilization-related uncharacterized protein
MPVEHGFRPRPIGQPNFAPFNDGVSGSGGSRREESGKQLIPISITEASLRAAMEEERRFTESRGFVFYPTLFMWRELNMTKTDLKLALFPDEVNRYLDEVKIAVVSLGYATLEPDQQRHFRRYLRQRAEVWETDHIQLSDEGKQLVRTITNVTGVPYNPLQSTFYFSTILNQPDPPQRTEGNIKR